MKTARVRYAPKAGATLMAPELKAGDEIEVPRARADELVASGAFQLVQDNPGENKPTKITKARD